MTFEVRHHAGRSDIARVYNVTIEDTGRTTRVHRSYKKRKEVAKKGMVFIKTDNCDKCNNIRVAGICINKKCASIITPKS